MFHCFACYKAEFFKRRWQSWRAIFFLNEISYRELEVMQMQKTTKICMGGKYKRFVLHGIMTPKVNIIFGMK